MAADAVRFGIRIVFLNGVSRRRISALVDEPARSFSDKQIGYLAEAHEISAGLLLDVLEGAA
jgi:hypothetical protein